jgi:hypothetical protein
MPRASLRLKHSGIRRTNIYGYGCQLRFRSAKSLAEDVAFTKAAIDSLKSEVVLVGHVVDVRGHPVADAYIQGWRHDGTGSDLLIVAATSDASGHFALPAYTILDKLTVFGFHDSRGIARGIVDVQKPQVEDIVVVLPKNVEDLTRR